MPRLQAEQRFAGTVRLTSQCNLASAQKKIQDFLKVRTSYDVLPLSFRLIVFDTTLLVKKSLNILLQNGECAASRAAGSSLVNNRMIGLLMWHRHRLRPAVGLEDFHVRGIADHFRLYQRHPVLLGQPRCTEPSGDVPPQQSSRYGCFIPHLWRHTD